MKYLAISVLISALFFSCSNKNDKIVAKAYADSLITNYKKPQIALDNEKDMLFWKNRIDPNRPAQVNESRYAGTLISRFYQFGDISDIKQAEEIEKGISKTYNNKLASPFTSLAATAMMQHRFAQADTLYKKAIAIGVEGFTANTLGFDVNFELGRYTYSSFFLKKLQAHKDYSYYFRRSKNDHLSGAIDSAIIAMTHAADLAKTAPYLQSIALSNTADLYIHAGDLQKAGALYKRSLVLNPLDFHSILGLGWLAIVNDKNDTTAERLFKFVMQKNKLPDPLFKLYQMAQARGNKALEKIYAQQFVAASTNPVYGQMYNKYVIEIYTGILQQPAKAEEIAKNELLNRATPQTYAWYAYTLLMNNKKAEAYKIFEQQVSGKPLEGLELYYMGVMMKGLDKGYNAQEFFKAADKNKYDLSPDMQKQLAANLEE